MPPSLFSPMDSKNPCNSSNSSEPGKPTLELSITFFKATAPRACLLMPSKTDFASA